MTAMVMATVSEQMQHGLRIMSAQEEDALEAQLVVQHTMAGALMRMMKQRWLLDLRQLMTMLLMV